MIDERFRPAIERIKQLQDYDRYDGAFIFGSVAQGTTTDESDLDVIVETTTAVNCGKINHPIISGVKLDISFNTTSELATSTRNEIEAGIKPPFIMGALIIFDKTGNLTKLREQANKAKPKPLNPVEYQDIQFMFYHTDNKAKQALTKDSFSALLSMHVGLFNILKVHFRLNEQWLVSDKVMLKNLRSWDPQMAHIVEAFLSQSDAEMKYFTWRQILEHVSKPMGGLQHISKINCLCRLCSKDLSLLT